MMTIEEYYKKYLPYFGKNNLRTFYQNIQEAINYDIDVIESGIQEYYNNQKYGLSFNYNTIRKEFVFTFHYNSKVLKDVSIRVDGKVAQLYLSSYLYDKEANLDHYAYHELSKAIQSMSGSEWNSLLLFMDSYLVLKPAPDTTNRVKFMLECNLSIKFISKVILISYWNSIGKDIPVFVVTIIENKEDQKIFNINSMAKRVREFHDPERDNLYVDQNWSSTTISYPDIKDLLNKREEK